jgi:predicted O-linked N-acetylglucosamine transferase (SPINDLY family)
MLPKLWDLLKPRAKSASPSGESAALSEGASSPLTAAGVIASPTLSVPLAEQLFEQAQGLQQQGQLEEAIKLYGLVIDGIPDRARVYYKRANALNGLGRLEEAVEDYDRAISLDPSYAYAWCNRGSVLEGLGRREEALESYDRALALDPNDALTHYNRGSVLKDLMSLEDALASYAAAIALNPDYAEAYVNQGNVLQLLRRHTAAVESFGHAIELKPVIAEAYLGRGASLHFLRRLRDALTDYNKAIALKPDLSAAFLTRGHLLADLDRFEEAAQDYSKAAELTPNAESYQSLAAALVRLKRIDLAIANLDKAIALEPERDYLIGNSRAAKMHACHWDGLGADLNLIANLLRKRKRICNPLSVAALMDSSALQRSAGEIWVQDQILSTCEEDLTRIDEMPSHSGRPPSGKIRIGYFSADFRTHPVACLTAGMFECHDRSKFEVTAFAFGPEANDAMQARLAKAFDRFIDVRQRSNLEVAALTRELGIDIAVDLNGFTAHRRAEIFALRAAPIQINFLGYPGTMGAQFMDYLIADGMVIPRAQQAHYAEKIVYLKNSFMPFDSSYAISDRVFAREELGLPSAGFVFCCFNNNYKIMPAIFDRWMRILSRVEGSVLWLSQANATAVGNLRNEAERRGVAGGRLIFAERIESPSEHLARLKVADLFLDTFPYNAHATAMDALWAGVPLLTYAGESFASRVAASLLCTAGLPEFVAGSTEQYEEKAVELAKNPTGIRAARRKLAQRDTPLFDTEMYTRNIEAAYEAIYERIQSGRPPAHLNEQLAR